MLVPICIYYWQTQRRCYPCNKLGNKVLLVLPNSVSMFHFISLYTFSTSFCQDRLITNVCDNFRKLATCGGKTVNNNVIHCQRILMMVYRNCVQHFGHCPSYMAKNPTGWICLHLQMKWGGNLLLLHITQRWSQSLHTKQNLDNIYKLKCHKSSLRDK